MSRPLPAPKASPRTPWESIVASSSRRRSTHAREPKFPQPGGRSGLNALTQRVNGRPSDGRVRCRPRHRSEDESGWLVVGTEKMHVPVDLLLLDWRLDTTHEPQSAKGLAASPPLLDSRLRRLRRSSGRATDAQVCTQCNSVVHPFAREPSPWLPLPRAEPSRPFGSCDHWLSS